MAGETNNKNRAPLVAHVWADYVPDSFVEPHAHMAPGESRFSSVNLVANLWDNGKEIDSRTFWMFRRSCRNLVAPTLLFRVYRRATTFWRRLRFRNFCRDKASGLGASLIHSHFGTTGCKLNRLIERTGWPHVVTLYGYDGSAALLNWSLLREYKRMYRSASRIIVLCEIVKQRLIATGCEAGKIVVWNMPAGIENFPYRARAPGKQVRLLMAARFVEAKGHAYILEAFARIARKGYPVRLVLVGYGNLTAQIEKKIEALGLRSFVSLIDNKLIGDFTSDYRSLLNECDIFVLPSVRDRSGTDEAGPALSMVCAQAAGLPVVCTPFPGSEISLIDGVTGLYCKERDTDSLTEKLEYLLDRPHLWNELGRKGSELVRKEFSQKTQMEKLFRVYEETLGLQPQPERPKPGPRPAFEHLGIGNA